MSIITDIAEAIEAQGQDGEHTVGGHVFRVVDDGDKMYAVVDALGGGEAEVGEHTYRDVSPRRDAAFLLAEDIVEYVEWAGVIA